MPTVAFVLMSSNLNAIEVAKQKQNLSSEFKHSSALMRRKQDLQNEMEQHLASPSLYTTRGVVYTQYV